MGLLHKSEQTRGKLLENLTADNQNYLDHISSKRKKIIYEEIGLQRKAILSLLKKKKPAEKNLETSKIKKKRSSSTKRNKISVKKKSAVKKKISIKRKTQPIIKKRNPSVKKSVIEDISGKSGKRLTDSRIKELEEKVDKVVRRWESSKRKVKRKKVNQSKNDTAINTEKDHLKKDKVLPEKTEKLKEETKPEIKKAIKERSTSKNKEKEKNLKERFEKKKQEKETLFEKENILENNKPELRPSGKVNKKDEIIEDKKIDLKKIKKERLAMPPEEKDISSASKEKPKKIKDISRDYIFTGIPGFDDLLVDGIPKGSSNIIAGGAGSGKTIFCLQTLAHHASKGKRCLYMSFEEPDSRLIEHMEDFGMDPKKLIQSGRLMIQRMNPFDITRNVDAMLAEQKGELLIKVDPVIIPRGFNPDFIVVDSLTAIASAFTGKEENYRIYIEQLFRFFEKIKATSFLITETEQIPKIFSKSGVEEFLADGVIVFYNIKRGNIRERAVELLKLRGAEHQKRIVAFEVSDKGLVIYPEQEVFEGVEES